MVLHRLRETMDTDKYASCRDPILRSLPAFLCTTEEALIVLQASSVPRLVGSMLQKGVGRGAQQESIHMKQATFQILEWKKKRSSINTIFLVILLYI